VLLSFDSLLRVGEAAGLLVGDVMEVARVDARLRPSLVLRIRNAKTADDTRGEQQSVTVLEPAVATLLRDYVAERKRTAADGELLFGRSKHQLEAAFVAAAGGMGGATRFTWHSMRHGGATYLSMAGVRAEDILIRGRWKSLEGLKRYLQTGQAVVAAHGVAADVVALGERVAAALSAV